MTTQKAPSASTEAAAKTAKKGWSPKTPVEIVLTQITKMETRVAGLRAELAREEKELGKLQRARQVLEAT